MADSKNRITWFGQVRVYLGKCFRLFVNEKQWKNFITALILMVIIMAVTKDLFKDDFLTTKNGLFTVISGCIWVGLFNSIQSICRERAIIKREYRTGMRLSAYVTAHAIYEVFLSAIEALIILILLYIKYGENIDGTGTVTNCFFDLYITFFLVIFAADTIAIFISSLVRKENTAMTIMPFVLVIQLVMSGAIFPLNGGISEAISNITASKWGLEAALRIANSSAGMRSSYDYYQTPLEIGGAKISFNVPQEVYSDRDKLLLAWGILLLSAVIFLIGSMLILRLVDKDKRI